MPTTLPLYRLLASLIEARANCERSGNTEWFKRHNEHITELCGEYLPSGSGVDNGTAFADDLSSPNKLVFNTSFHHMTEDGVYDGWTDHSVIVRPEPSLARAGLSIVITGRNRNGIKEYLNDLFYSALTTAVPK